ncbi:hypothetical protein EYZ11_012097 [Aspergillus tanneri]|uniref:Carboxylic ester hydrolase n=1 Tax=Aspergillus tanneri TaxID=1220188 RepID=A0A4S3J165_9EURO|nr:hypothetical protein EYZ11_012097 [Aspergillus tanneri]
MDCLLILAILAPLALGLNPHNRPQPISSYVPVVNEQTSVTLLYHNNLNGSDDSTHVGAILLDGMHQYDIRDACRDIGETMISKQTLEDHREDFKHLFSYLVYSGRAKPTNSYYIRNGLLSVTKDSDDFQMLPYPGRDFKLPVLCTHTVSSSVTVAAKHARRKEVRMESGNNSYIGFRDQKSFRFLGIPYANTPQRFTYATLHSPKKSAVIRATNYGPSCAQAGGGSEDCLYLNIYTPYIPRNDAKKGLRPVLFWIHGGDFTNGSGADRLTDGGNLASREDIVVVTFNYRLSTLGFLAVPGTDIHGNYGIADQVLALEWTTKNIAQFGGDPNRITIIGESAGAASVRALLGSSPALGMFQGAVVMSNLGGGVGLGLGSDYATTYSSFITIAESYNATGKRIFSEAGCGKGNIKQQVSCLRQVSASALSRLNTAARHIVQDGHYVTSRELDLVNKGKNSGIPVIFGNGANDGASFCKYPPASIKSPTEGIQAALGIDEIHAQRILDSGLFPYHDSGNMTGDSFNVAQHRPPATSELPNGDPEVPYFRGRASDLPWVFGNLETLRDPPDLDSVRVVSAYFSEFVRSGQPNPPGEYLQARGYSTTLDVIKHFDRWEPISNFEGPMQLMGFPSVRANFQDIAQCDFLGYPMTHYFRWS